MKVPTRSMDCSYLSTVISGPPDISTTTSPRLNFCSGMSGSLETKDKEMGGGGRAGDANGGNFAIWGRFDLLPKTKKAPSIL